MKRQKTIENEKDKKFFLCFLSVYRQRSPEQKLKEALWKNTNNKQRTKTLTFPVKSVK
tara:strand:- start:461 stop:634 length:174 start_codon:yes stop_codon:yes gene_type:complete